MFDFTCPLWSLQPTSCLECFQCVKKKEILNWTAFAYRMTRIFHWKGSIAIFALSLEWHRFCRVGQPYPNMNGNLYCTNDSSWFSYYWWYEEWFNIWINETFHFRLDDDKKDSNKRRIDVALWEINWSSLRQKQLPCPARPGICSLSVGQQWREW